MGGWGVEVKVAEAVAVWCWGRCEPRSAAPQSPCGGLSTLCFNNSLAETPSLFSSLTNPAATTGQGPKVRLKCLLPKVSTSFGKSKLRFQVLQQLLGLRVSGHVPAHSVSSRRSQQCSQGSQPAQGYNPTFVFTSCVALDESRNLSGPQPTATGNNQYLAHG